MSELKHPLRGGGMFLLGVGFVAIVGAAFPAQVSAVATQIITAESPITCSSTGTASCLNVTNSNSGVAVYGTSNSGTALRGLSKSNNGLKATSTSGYGVYGQSSSGGAAVYGTMNNGKGVAGVDTAGGTGVSGSSVSGTGVYGSTSSGGVGIEGIGNSNTTAMEAYNSANGNGVNAVSFGGNALLAIAHGSQPSADIEASAGGNGLNVTSANGNAVVASPGAGDAFVAQVSGNSAGFLESNNGSPNFFVDSSGDIYYSGTMMTLARTRVGNTASAFGSKSTMPTLEDTGTARLVDGLATVPLDRVFAATIDATNAYHVFVTPNGDSGQLYVANKTPNGFVVRESHGGRSTVDFDYRIVAVALGHAGDRMALGTAPQLRPGRDATIRPHAALPLPTLR